MTSQYRKYKEGTILNISMKPPLQERLNRQIIFLGYVGGRGTRKDMNGNPGPARSKFFQDVALMPESLWPEHKALMEKAKKLRKETENLG